ncbi:hypothetical protein CROQUDRAFT_102941 [Cronartium quercuum f. sp. fusiforme G11]|uniref:Uncharacterized protein n=1 Tax=Cronartium quercuum f. sp. fusiforme G11 TaxID=708437 RepID=A0A9P6NV03_9BASI|nr:hypothetical protein CROQUDRAFT_102941 [Cronartium quercuum f. sp. fusiforme G11]
MQRDIQSVSSNPPTHAQPVCAPLHFRVPLKLGNDQFNPEEVVFGPSVHQAQKELADHIHKALLGLVIGPDFIQYTLLRSVELECYQASVFGMSSNSVHCTYRHSTSLPTLRVTQHRKEIRIPPNQSLVQYDALQSHGSAAILFAVNGVGWLVTLPACDVIGAGPR